MCYAKEPNIALQHSGTHCATLQHAATRCNTLQHTATYIMAKICYVKGPNTYINKGKRALYERAKELYKGKRAHHPAVEPESKANTPY